MHKILYIHGAFSSSLSFRYIQDHLPEHESLAVEYSVEQSLDDLVSFVSQTVKQHEDIHIVAHSLGGVIGVAAALQNKNVASVLTISSPFGGSRAAEMLRWVNSHELYRSLYSQNHVLKKVRTKPLHCQHRCIVTTYGDNPMMFEPNDGVVSFESQMAVTHAERIEVPFNHFEVLLSDTTIDLIKEFTFNA